MAGEAIPSAGNRGGWHSGRFAHTFAAIDLGTNNCRLLIATPTQNGFSVVDAFSRIVRLGEGLATSGKLSDAAIERTKSVCIIEKAPKLERGGNSAMTGHMRYAFNGVDDLRPLVKNMSENELRKLLEGGLPKRTEADIWDEIMRVTNNQSDEELLHVHVT